MIEPITLERWQQAQIAERKLHTKSLEEGIHHYRIAYGHNFRYLGIDPRITEAHIIEVGCADFPALMFIDDIYDCMIFEPMPSEFLKHLCMIKGITLLDMPFEDMIPIRSKYEVWMFNVLQHVIDPELFITKAKTAGIVRYFEPIDTEITDYHPHSFTKDHFDRWFPGVNKFYNETTNECFHNGPCCYGVWNNPNV
jgi:hypothetical protein